MRPFVLERGKVRIERHRVKRPLHVDEHPLFQIGGVCSDILHRHAHILTERVKELHHTRGCLHIALRTVVIVPLHPAEECDREKQNDNEVPVVRHKTVAQIFDAHKKKCRKCEKRQHIPYCVVELAVLRDVVVGIKCQTGTS